MTDERAREIFTGATKLPQEERAAFLDEQCGDHAELLAEVQELLARDHGSTKVETEKYNRFTGYQVGETVGPFKILAHLGEGGFGAVYLAEQTKPVKRRVALKVIKPGMDSKAVLARFDAEQQALALMDHPGIAKVFDAGATPEGRPYFVMEYVKGEPLNEFCDNQKLNTAQRLELFARVCDAIQHAHQKGVIHRDLKPSNILVAIGEHDEPEPKVIDFGIAKATSQQLTEQTIYTQQGQMIGTPEYMSPEQADMRAVDIDIRTDVYSLGVILYELLSGRLPFDPKTLREKGLAEIQRIIREDDPPKPSTRLSTLEDEEGTKIAKARKTQLDALANTLKKELEWIPLRALKKERRERYGSAEALAQDVRRYLSGEPLEAGPDSRAYRLKKYARRNKGPVIAAALIVLILIAATVISLVLLVEADRQRTAAELERIKTQSALEQVIQMAYVANIMAAKAELETNDPAAAKRRLDKARTILGNPPAEEMPFEWKEISSFDDSAISFDLPTDLISPSSINADATRWATIDDDNTVGIFDTTSGLKLSSLTIADSEKLLSTRFSPDSKRLALCIANGDRVRTNPYDTRDCTYRIWDIENSDVLAEFPAKIFGSGGGRPTFSPDGTRLAVEGVDDGNEYIVIFIIDIQSNTTLFSVPRDQQPCLAFNLAGTQFVMPSRDHSIHMWDIQAGERVATLKGHKDTIYDVEYSPDGAQLASCGADGTIRIWDSQTGDNIATLDGHEGLVWQLVFSPDGTRIASLGAHDATIRIWDAQSGENIAILLHYDETPRPSMGIDVAFSSDGNQLSLFSSSGHVRRWDLGFIIDDLFTVSSRSNSPNEVLATAYSPDGAQLASCGERGIVIWDTQKREMIANLRVQEGSNNQSGDQPSFTEVDEYGRMLTVNSSNDVAYSPDSTRLASCGADGTIRIWDTLTGANIATFNGHMDAVTQVSYSPDGTRLASCGEDNTIRIWDAQTGENIRILGNHRVWEFVDIAYSPDGTQLASCGWGGRDSFIRIWDPKTGDFFPFSGHEDSFYDVAYSPDGTQLASCGADKTIRIWDPQTGIEISTFSPNSGSVVALAYSPDGSRLATGGGSEISIWDHLQGELLATFSDQKSHSISDIEFSPDGNQIAYTTFASAIHLWDTRSRSRFYQDGLLARQRSTSLSSIVDFWIEKSEGDKTLVQAMLDRGLKDRTPEKHATLRNLVLMNLAEQQYGPDYTTIRKHSRELFNQRRFEEAERYLRPIIDKKRAYWGSEAFVTLTCIDLLGYVLIQQDKYEESLACFTETEEAYRKKHSGYFKYVIYSIRMLGWIKLRQGKFGEAQTYYDEALEMRRDKLGDTHADTQESIGELVDLYESWHEEEPDAGHDAKAAEYRALHEELSGATPAEPAEAAAP